MKLGQETTCRRWTRIFLGELVGTFILTLLCDASYAEYLGQAASGSAPALYLQVAFGIGLAVAAGVASSAGASGAHLNPAVTTSFMLAGVFPWRDLPAYLAAEYLGGFLGAAACYGAYADLIEVELGGTGELAGATIFASYPTDAYPVGTWNLVLDQAVCTACLMVIILSFVDQRNLGIPLAFAPLLIGLGLVAIRLSFAANAGCSMNPAADMGGYGHHIF